MSLDGRPRVLTVGLFCLGLLAVGLLSRRLEARSLTPQIVLLTLGLLLGFAIRDQPELIADAAILHEAGEVALILALFVDAARIDVGALRGSAGLPLRLLAIGLPLTVVLGAIVAVVIFPDLTIVEAVLLAALVAPTDAALGAQVINSPRVPLRIRQALNVESGLNDGLVTPLVVVAALVVAEGTTGGGGAGRCDVPDRARDDRRDRRRRRWGAVASRRRRAQLDHRRGTLDGRTGARPPGLGRRHAARRQRLRRRVRRRDRDDRHVRPRPGGRAGVRGSWRRPDRPDRVLPVRDDRRRHRRHRPASRSCSRSSP